MKKIILTAILFLCLFQNGNSQHEPLIKKYIKSYQPASEDTFIVIKEEFYDYDLSNNLSFKETKEYTSGGSLWKQKGISYEYYPNQLLKRKNFRRYNPDVDLWITEDLIDYKYDSNNCLIEEYHIENIGGIITRRITYQQNENCQWNSKHVDSPFLWDNSIFYTIYHLERIYHADGVSYEEKYFDYFAPTDSSFLDNYNIQIFDERGNIIEQRYTDLFPYHGGYSDKKFVFQYDQFNNRISKESYERESDTADLNLKYIISHENEYDENDFLKRTKEELVSYSNDPPTVNPNYSYTINYKNTCEGIHEFIDAIHESGYKEREQFIYEGKNECIDLDKIYLNVRVSPNPSNGFLKIFSPIFQTGNTEISVYSIDGKVLLQKNENSRLTHSILDLTFLQNGFYILQLRNGDHFVKSKIVIAK